MTNRKEMNVTDMNMTTGGGNLDLFWYLRNKAQVTATAKAQSILTSGPALTDSGKSILGRGPRLAS